MNQTLLLVRHGQASAGSDNYDRLSSCGREQSRHLGDWWRACKTSPSACFHGTLERQRDTAKLVLDTAGLPTECKVLTGLDEYDHRAVDAHLGERLVNSRSGGTEGAVSAAPVNPESMSYTDYASIMRRWRDAHTLPQTLEEWPAFASRGWTAISDEARMHPTDATLAFFTSGGIISTVLATVLGLDFEHCIDAIWRVRNASITTLAYDGEHARLVEFNNVNHLEVHHDRDLVTLI